MTPSFPSFTKAHDLVQLIVKTQVCVANSYAKKKSKNTFSVERKVMK